MISACGRAVDAGFTRPNYRSVHSFGVLRGLTQGDRRDDSRREDARQTEVVASQIVNGRSSHVPPHRFVVVLLAAAALNTSHTSAQARGAQRAAPEGQMSDLFHSRSRVTKPSLSRAGYFVHGHNLKLRTDVRPRVARRWTSH